MPIIGFITSEPIEEFVKSFEEDISKFCNILYLRVNHIEDCRNHYVNNFDLVDGFIFSGRMFYYSGMSDTERTNKPLFVMDESRSDLKKVLLKLLLDNRNLNLSRIFIDLTENSSSFDELKEIIGDGPFPMCINDYFKEERLINLSNQNYHNLTKAIIEKHLQLHTEGLIDYSITRLGTNLEAFKEKDIPYVYALPTKDYTLNFFIQAAYFIATENSKDSKIGLIMIDPKNNLCDASFYEFRACLENVIQSYRIINGLDLTIQEYKGKIILLTQLRDLKKMTSDFTLFNLKNYLNSKVDQPFALSLSTADTIYQAKRNAEKALSLISDDLDEVYYISFNDEVIGPIEHEKPTKISLRPSQTIKTYSEKLRVDHVTLQKIISFTEVNGSIEMTAKDLAEFLDVTQRTARRFLCKIEENGGAKSYNEKMKSRKGRPSKYYVLNFINEMRILDAQQQYSQARRNGEVEI